MIVAQKYTDTAPEDKDRWILECKFATKTEWCFASDFHVIIPLIVDEGF
jgi:hypothetical protein